MGIFFFWVGWGCVLGPGFKILLFIFFLAYSDGIGIKSSKFPAWIVDSLKVKLMHSVLLLALNLLKLKIFIG